MNDFTSLDSKRILFDILKPFFKKSGFKFISGGAPSFVKNVDFGYVDIMFTFSSHPSIGFVHFTPIHLYLKEVEDIIDEISFPGREKWQIGEGMWRITTIQDTFSRLYQSNNLNPINTEEKTRNYANDIIDYLENEGNDFITTYSFLPNVLRKIDTLISNNKYPVEILSGGLNYWFRTLIISNLCNDLKYLDKVTYVDSNMYKKGNEDWYSYYEKLKIKLSTLEPRYNL